MNEEPQLQAAIEFLQGWNQSPLPLVIALTRLYDVKTEWRPQKDGGYAMNMNFSSKEVQPCLQYVCPSKEEQPARSTITTLANLSPQVFILNLPDDDTEGSAPNQLEED